MNTTYSFLDSVMILTHFQLPVPITITGEGVGGVTVVMLVERTSHQVAADGAIMINKIAGNNGQVVVELQQTSAAHKALLKFYNSLVVAPPSEWAQALIYIRNVTDGTSHLCTGVAPVKIPDKRYEKEGQLVAWVFMAADIQSLSV